MRTADYFETHPVFGHSEFVAAHTVNGRSEFISNNCSSCCGPIWRSIGHWLLE
jgi:hypothetical protein